MEYSVAIQTSEQYTSLNMLVIYGKEPNDGAREAPRFLSFNGPAYCSGWGHREQRVYRQLVRLQQRLLVPSDECVADRQNIELVSFMEIECQSAEEHSSSQKTVANRPAKALEPAAVNCSCECAWCRIQTRNNLIKTGLRPRSRNCWWILRWGW